MKTFRTTFAMIAIAMLITFSAVSAKADQFDKKTLLTFDHPVEVPGLVLSAGTYAFSRVGDNPNVVRISSPDGTHVYATLLTVADYRLDPAEETVITFEERPNGNPQAIKSWFYPGDNTGEEFIYR
jgi:hypothetical protein